MKSWRTTVFGALALCAGVVITADYGPLVTKIAASVQAMATGIGLMVARDQKQSEKEKRDETAFITKQ